MAERAARLRKPAGATGPAAPTPSLDTFVENLPGNVYRRVRRPDGSYHFEYLSSGLFRQFGIDHERLLAEEAIRFDWIHPDDRARMVSDLEISAAMLGLLDHRIRIVGQGGRVYWARGIARPSRRPDGATVWDGIVIDVTREVEAEAALRVAKEEADRAHRLAAALMSEATSTLGPLVRELDGLLDRVLAGGFDDDLRRTLTTSKASLASALRSLVTENGVGFGTDGPRREGRGQTLTKRQAEVLGLVTSGLSNKAIAQRLDITPGTAKLHVAAVLRTVGARSRRDLRPPTG